MSGPSTPPRAADKVSRWRAGAVSGAAGGRSSARDVGAQRAVRLPRRLPKIVCEMFENCKDEKLGLEEGGFFVISKKDDKLYLEYEFHNYNNFNKVFYKR